MRCSSCGIENRKGARFCAGCGTALVAATCPECGTEISSSAKFCDRCGATVATQPGKSADVSTGDRVAASTAPGKPADRRQMSLLCCDLVDSTKLARRLDPEDLRYGVTNFHRISKEIIDKYEGYYAQYMGDGFMAYFSYPVAHEDDAYRAVLTGLEIVEAIGRFNIKLREEHGFELELRVGVNTGQVVVDEFVVGEPPNYRGPGSGRRHPQCRHHHGDDKAAATVQRVRLRRSRREEIEERRLAAACFEFSIAGRGVTSPSTRERVDR